MTKDDRQTMDGHGITSQINAEATVMSKERKSNKEAKKMPGMTAKEKRAAKKVKKSERGRIGE